MHNFESPKKQDNSYPSIACGTGNGLRQTPHYPNHTLIESVSATLPHDANLKDGVSINISDYINKAVELTKGRKFDNGKPRYSLLPALALEETVKVLTYGSIKYEDFNWMKVKKPNDRFFSAAQRHLWSWQKGEKIDPESNTNHLANAITNLMFMLELEVAKTNETELANQSAKDDVK